MLRRYLLAASLCATVAQPALAVEKPLLQVGTERSAPEEIRPSQGLARVVVDAVDKDDIGQLDACLLEQGLKRKDYASLLRAVEIRAGAGRSLWFVRPALKPYCQALYGAHLFRYFWIEEQKSGDKPHYNLLFKNGGDSFAVYRQQSHGLNDIEATGCIMSECRSARMAFDGRKYRPVSCSWTNWDKQKREISHVRSCGSEDWRDDQASGFFLDK